MTGSRRRAVGLVILFALGIVFALYTAPQSLWNAGEDALYRINPTATRAYAYGERHFDANNPSAYDIDRAQYFFELAATKDVNIPYLYHELARVSFLRGNFHTALAQINFQISLQGDTTPNSYYVRALIEGYMGRYDAAAQDYERFLRSYPHNWAGINDYAWVLLKAGRAHDAERALAKGLQYFPDNPWLLNSEATALYELKKYPDALVAVQRAAINIRNLTEAEWLTAYPGNDPKIAGLGVAAFKKAVEDNMHTVLLAVASSTIQ